MEFDSNALNYFHIVIDKHLHGGGGGGWSENLTLSALARLELEVGLISFTTCMRVIMNSIEILLCRLILQHSEYITCKVYICMYTDGTKDVEYSILNCVKIFLFRE